MAQLFAKTLTRIVVASVALSGQAIRNVPRISIDELKALIDQQAVLVLDVASVIEELLRPRSAG